MKRVDSDALDILNKSLGLTGAGSPVTELADGVIDQTLSVNEIARRGRTVHGSTGVYNAIMSNTHAGADTQESNIDPYNPGTRAATTYPASVPEQFDVWLLGATLLRESGTGTLTGSLAIILPATAQGFGVDQAGAAVLQVDPMMLIAWTGLVSTNIVAGNKSGSMGPYEHLGIRLPRGTPNARTSLRFATISSAAVVFNCSLIIGLFPVALGQDGIV